MRDPLPSSQKGNRSSCHLSTSAPFFFFSPGDKPWDWKEQQFCSGSFCPSETLRFHSGCIRHWGDEVCLFFVASLFWFIALPRATKHRTDGSWQRGSAAGLECSCRFESSFDKNLNLASSRMTTQTKTGRVIIEQESAFRRRNGGRCVGGGQEKSCFTP